MIEVFLGGTTNGSTWRDRITPKLKVQVFNPVVKNWTPECLKKEIRKRKECEVVLYVLTPKMRGVYSVAEVVEDSIRKPKQTILTLLKKDEEQSFTEAEWKSLEAVEQMVSRNGAKTLRSLEDTISYINDNYS